LKILVISPVYGLSGVPLGQLRLAKCLANIGHKVDLIYGHKQYSKIEKLKNVNVIFLNKIRVLGMLFPLIKYLLFNKPDIIFSAEDHLNVIVIVASILTFSKAKISVSSRVTPHDTYKYLNVMFSKSWFLKIMFPLVNFRANVLTCVSKDMVKQYKKIFSTTKQVYAYNIVLTKEAIQKMKEKVEHKWFKNKKTQTIIASGTLAEWKCFDDLIMAASIMKKKKINFKLLIIGGGPDKLFLENMIKSKGLTKKVQILKPVLNTLKYFYNSDIFVLSSRVEGMPNVMIEAMMCGCTVVSTDCHTGPREIIGKNKYGYLSKVNNPNDLAKNIIKAMKDKVSKNKINKILIKFSENNVIRRHFSLLKVERKRWLI
jgi:glycosyltransferase involved in cell wall biosynthesis